jgi:hypothetical protein
MRGNMFRSAGRIAGRSSGATGLTPKASGSMGMAMPKSSGGSSRAMLEAGERDWARGIAAGRTTDFSQISNLESMARRRM